MKKVYLNTIEEAIKALRNGETVYNDMYSCGDQPIYYMQDGVIISYYKESGRKYINSGSIEFKKDKFYCIEKEPIKLEVGKFYRTRDGEKVCCFYKYKTNYEFNWAFIKVNEQPDRAIFKSRDDGRQWTSENAYHGNDIVDYWE